MLKRRGVSLVEAVTVMAGSALLLGVTVALMHTLLRTGDATRNRVHWCGSIDRLAETFRQDVHAAVSEGTPESDGHRFDLADGATIVYQFKPGNVARTESQGESVTRRESFVLPPRSLVSIEVDPDSSPGLISLIIGPDPEAPKRLAGPALRIEAMANKDRRTVASIPPPEEDLVEESPAEEDSNE